MKGSMVSKKVAGKRKVRPGRRRSLKRMVNNNDRKQWSSGLNLLLLPVLYLEQKARMRFLHSANFFPLQVGVTEHAAPQCSDSTNLGTGVCCRGNRQ